MELDAEVIVVGGGIAGLSLASALSRDGVSVVVLEASLQYEDRVRGESMTPWGVAEAQELGVLSSLLEADARVTSTWVHYDSLLPTEVSLENRIPVGMMIPDVSGSLNLRHPEACSALAQRVVGEGVQLIRGVSDVTVDAGSRPGVTVLDTSGDVISFRPRVVVGADGRNSTVRRQVGVELERLAPSHMIAGVLFAGLDDLDLDHDFLATSDDLFMASFRQHHGQLRVYLAPGMREKHRFTGPDGMNEFRRSVNFACLPFGDALGAATPIGPLATYAGDDTWTPTPFVDGVVLVGDAAGYNSPIVGQGLAIAMRDARLVRDAIRSGDTSPAGFARYGLERMERMRRLRNGAMFMAALGSDDCDNRIARRAKFFDLQMNEPLMMAMLGGMFAGPENAPPEAFDGHLRDLLIAA